MFSKDILQLIVNVVFFHVLNPRQYIDIYRPQVELLEKIISGTCTRKNERKVRWDYFVRSFQ